MAKTPTVGFKELDAKLDRVIDAMTTKDDIRRVEAQIESLEDRVENVAKIQHDILLSLDKPATAIEKLTLENAALGSHVSRHDLSITQIARERGVKLANH